MLYTNSVSGKGTVVISKDDAGGRVSLDAAVSAAENRINIDPSVDQITISEKTGKRVAMIERGEKGGPAKKTLLR